MWERREPRRTCDTTVGTAFAAVAVPTVDAQPSVRARRSLPSRGSGAHAERAAGWIGDPGSKGAAQRRQLVAEFGAPVVDLMREIKLALDPRQILNPGKIFERAA